MATGLDRPPEENERAHAAAESEAIKAFYDRRMARLELLEVALESWYGMAKVGFSFAVRYAPALILAETGISNLANRPLLGLGSLAVSGVLLYIAPPMPPASEFRPKPPTG